MTFSPSLSCGHDALAAAGFPDVVA